MSTGIKRPLAVAQKSAEEFRRMFEPSFYEKWLVAGSVRRRKSEVTDVEHVVIPAFGEVTLQQGLFMEARTVNLLWRRMDELVVDGILTKHIYGGSGPRFGDKYRGVEYGGILHEIFCADALNWGAVAVIRTGPADFSQGVVEKFKRGGVLRQQDGYLRYVASGEVVPVPDEQTYFKLAGITWTEPEKR